LGDSRLFETLGLTLTLVGGYLREPEPPAYTDSVEIEPGTHEVNQGNETEIEIAVHLDLEQQESDAGVSSGPLKEMNHILSVMIETEAPEVRL